MGSALSKLCLTVLLLSQGGREGREGEVWSQVSLSFKKYLYPLQSSISKADDIVIEYTGCPIIKYKIHNTQITHRTDDNLDVI